MAISDKPQPNPMTAPRYAEIPTFMRTPYSRDLNGVDIAFRVRKRAVGERRLDQQCRRETAVGVGILVNRFGRRRVKQQGFDFSDHVPAYHPGSGEGKSAATR